MSVAAVSCILMKAKSFLPASLILAPNKSYDYPLVELFGFSEPLKTSLILLEQVLFQTESNQTLDSISSVLQENMPTGAKVILFGSQARRDANENSDWDILILLNQPKITNEDFFKFAYPLVELGWTLNLTISPIMYTFDDWKRRSFTPFYKNVEKEGVEIWH